MYLAWDEKPTNELRWKTLPISADTQHTFLQQKWLVRRNFKHQYEWRAIPKVGDKAPDIEPYDENPNLCD